MRDGEEGAESRKEVVYYERTPAAADRYDALHRDQTRDVRFYVEEARASGGPVLEVGCGTGRVTLPIARSGVSVVGIDCSEAMLRQASEKLATEGDETRKRCRLVRADMERFAFRERFRRVILPFRVFQHALTVDRQLNVLASVHEALDDDGLLVLDVFDPRVEMLAGGLDGPGRVSDSGRRYVDQRGEWRERFVGRYDLPDQLLDLTFIYERLGPGEEVEERAFEPLRLRYFFRFEIEHLLARAGYAVEALYGGWDRGPFEEHGQDMVWVARKAID